MATMTTEASTEALAPARAHAPHLLRYCVKCPAWAPEYAKATNDADEQVCKAHYLADAPADLVGAR